MNISAVILASGKGKRMEIAGKKQFLPLNGIPVIAYSVNKFLKIPEVKEIVLVISGEDEERVKEIAGKDDRIKIVLGGERRQDSSINGVNAAKYDFVAVHDAARPNFNVKTLKKMISELNAHDCVVPFIKAKDTVRYGKNGIETLERKHIKLIQTPQLFRKEKILKALEHTRGIEITDDMEAYLSLYDDYEFIEGDYDNIKITTMADFQMLSVVMNNQSLRSGFGYDSHRLEKGDGFILGGVKIVSDYSVIAHSDGDVILHALIDSVLGATGNGDIGDYFPDTEEWTKGISSVKMLKEILEKIQPVRIVNVDIVVILDKPKLGSIKKQIKNNIADYLHIDSKSVSVKAKTPEGRHNEEKIEVFSQILLNNFN